VPLPEPEGPSMVSTGTESFFVIWQF
jgi:hypothetical protein